MVNDLHKSNLNESLQQSCEIGVIIPILNYPTKVSDLGIPGWRSDLEPAFGPGRDPGDPGSNPTSGSLHGACFSLLPVSLSVCVS